MDAHAAELVGVDLFAHRSDDGRVFHAERSRFRVAQRRVVGLIRAANFARVHHFLVALAADVRLKHQQLLGIAQLALRVIEDAEHTSGGQVHDVATERRERRVAAGRLEALGRELVGFFHVGAVHPAIVGERRRLTERAAVVERAGLVMEALELSLDAARCGRSPERVFGRLAVVVIAQREFARAHIAAHAHGRDVFLVGGRWFVPESNRVLPIFAALGRIRQHEDRLVVVIDEVERNAGFFEHPRNERQVGLAVLDAVFARLVLALDLRHMLDAPFIEQLSGDIDLVHHLEDPAIAALRSEPQLRSDLDVVGREAFFIDAALVEFGADTPPRAFASFGAASVQREARFEADDLFEVDVGVRGYRHHGHRERHVHPLLDAVLAYVKTVFRRDRNFFIDAHIQTPDVVRSLLLANSSFLGSFRDCPSC